LIGREEIAFTAHYYGQDPLTVERWKSREIYEWYLEAVKIETKKWKALSDGQKS
jgi:hypothetical protein